MPEDGSNYHVNLHFSLFLSVGLYSRPPFATQAIAIVGFFANSMNQPRRETSNLWKYNSGFSYKWSHGASMIIGAMLRGCPVLMRGALMLQKGYRLDRILMMARLVRLAASVIREIVSASLVIISWNSRSIDLDRLGGAMVRYTTTCDDLPSMCGNIRGAQW